MKRIALLTLLAGHLCAQIPSTYSDLYSTLKQDLSDWESKISLLCGGCSPYPWFGAGQLTSANSNNGPNMVTITNYINTVDEEILMHKAMGIKAIAVEVSFPMLYPAYFTGQTTTYTQWSNFYSTVAQHIRNQGLKVIVESQSMMPSGIGANWTGLSTYYTSFLTFTSYAAARAQAVANVASVMNPDYFILQEEPDTESSQTGQPVSTLSNAVAMLNGSVSAARGTVGFTGKVGAGFGSWLQQYAAFANAYTQQACGTCVSSKLDFLDIHLYPINENASCSGCPSACVPCGNPDFARTNAMNIVATAATATNFSGAPMQMTMSQGWLRKVRDTEWPSSTQVGLYSSGSLQEARDGYSFWETSQSGTLLDQAWLSTVESLANYAHFLWLCPFNTQNWTAYITWSASTAINGEGTTNTANTPAAVYNMETSTAGPGRNSAVYTATAQAWHDALVPSDTAPPTVPTALTAQPSSASSLWLTWTASTDNVGVAGYQIWRDGVQIATAFQSPFEDTSLAPATTYTYQVYAFDLAKNVSIAASVTATTPKDTTPPSVPTGLVIQAVSVSQVSVAWTASTDADSPVAGYDVYRNGTQVATTTTTSYLDNGLAPATAYSYTIAAFDPVKNTSAQSAPISATTLADTTPPSVPTGLTATVISASQINLSWTASTDTDSPVAGYYIYQNGVQIGSSTTTSFQNTGLASHSTYTYTVAGHDPSNNTSAQSAPASATTLADSTPPTVPTGLTAQVISSSQINLSWTASTDPDSPVAGYNVYQNSILIATTTSTKFQSTGLTPAATYTFKISAFDPSNNTSGLSTAVSATTLKDTTPPTVPTGLTAAPVSSTQINLSWTASTDPDSPVAGYNIYRNGVKVATSATTSYQDTGLASKTTYSYTVSAYDAANNTSAQSTPVSATTLGDTSAPTVPTGLAATVISSAQINLSWVASADPDSPVAGYYIYQNGLQIGSSITTSFKSTGLLPATTYTYTVAAYDPSNNVSAQSAPVSATTPGDNTPPTVPTGLTAQVISSSQVNLSWTASTDPDSAVAGYHIYQNGTMVATTTVTSFQSTGLTPSTNYSFAVSAFDPANNTSALSTAVFATTLKDSSPPSVPTGLTALAASSTQVNLSWTASTDPDSPVAGYNIYRNAVKVGTSATTTFQDTGLTPNMTYTYTVSAYDPTLNTSGQSAPASATTLPDNTPPTVTITSPAPGTIISSQGNPHITLTASASDADSGIKNVQFFVDGASAGTVTFAPYTVSYNTKGLASGVHVVTAVATDNANNQATSAAVSFTLQ